MTEKQYLELLGNKTVFEEDELKKFYKKSNLYVITLLYCGFFGEGKNVCFPKLKELGIWKEDQHPYQMILSSEDIEVLLKEGKMNVKDLALN